MSTKVCLLIVDDEPLNRDLLERVLGADYDVLLAENAEEALEILAGDNGENVQLVLSDHWMPGKTGVELAGIVQEHNPGLPFVLITGFDQEQEVIDSQANGTLASVVGKPWRTKELRTLIQQLLR